MMTLVNEFYKAGKVTRKEFETLLILLNPVAPHMTEELWADLGYEGRLYQTAWPEFDEEKTVEAVARSLFRSTVKCAERSKSPKMQIKRPQSPLQKRQLQTN